MTKKFLPLVEVRIDVLQSLKVLGHQCADTGKCHHSCKTECFREKTCVPLSYANWLNNDWTIKTKNN